MAKITRQTAMSLSGPLLIDADALNELDTILDEESKRLSNLKKKAD